MTARAKLYATNSEDLVLTITVVSDEDSTPIDISTYSLTVTIKDRGGCIRDTLTLGSGVSFVTDGTDGEFTIYKRLTSYAPGMYSIGLLSATASDSVRSQIFVGELAIEDGVV